MKKGNAVACLQSVGPKHLCTLIGARIQFAIGYRLASSRHYLRRFVWRRFGVTARVHRHSPFDLIWSVAAIGGRLRLS